MHAGEILRPFRRAPVIAPPRQSIDRADAVSDLRSDPPLSARSSSERRPSGGSRRGHAEEAVGYSGSSLPALTPASAPAFAPEASPELRPWTVSSKSKGDPPHSVAEPSDSSAALPSSSYSSAASSQPLKQAGSSSHKSSISNDEYTTALRALRAQHEEGTAATASAASAAAVVSVVSAAPMPEAHTPQTAPVSFDGDHRTADIDVSGDRDAKRDSMPMEESDVLDEKAERISEKEEEEMVQAESGRLTLTEVDPSNEFFRNIYV